MCALARCAERVPAKVSARLAREGLCAGYKIPARVEYVKLANRCTRVLVRLEHNYRRATQGRARDVRCDVRACERACLRACVFVFANDRCGSGSNRLAAAFANAVVVVVVAGDAAAVF